jgi:hypothetical protein
VTDAFFFERLGGGRFRASERTTGPWDPRNQHAGPPSALLVGELERIGRPEMALARVTVEILGPIPIAEVEVDVGVERPGRSVELLRAELRAGGKPVLRALAWRVLRSPVGSDPGPVPPALPDAGDPPPAALGSAAGYAHAIEWRWAQGGWESSGPATVWTRLAIPVVADCEPTPLQRVFAVADSGNGVSSVLEWGRYFFINTELTVHLLREPRGEWVCLEARTDIAEGGAGLASSVLSDADGPVARGAQALLVAPRG